jgi:hypothetical protein
MTGRVPAFLIAPACDDQFSIAAVIIIEPAVRGKFNGE